MKVPMHHTIAPHASAFHAPRGDWATVLDCLCANFPAISREQWLDRFARGRVLDGQGSAIGAAQPHREGFRIFYFREVRDEKPIPVTESVLYVDEHLLVADKPHFLPVIPAGQFVEETLLRRLVRRFNNPDLVPLHRIDRHTAGLVLFSANATSRSAYQSLFRKRAIEKVYEAIAPALPHHTFPLLRQTRIGRGEPFLLSQEIAGEPNTETRIEVSERGDNLWHYTLHPVTGKKHQLRVHMAALGAPILHDTFYPTYQPAAADDYSRPLQLLAKRVRFIDPLNGVERIFTSRLSLAKLP